MSNIDEERLYYSIGEASKELDVEQHVLRFWEKQFKEIQPVKANKRRLYTKDDIKVIRKIKDLLHNKGYTIKGVQKLLRGSKEESIEFSTQDKQETILDAIKQLRHIQNELERSLAKK